MTLQDLQEHFEKFHDGHKFDYSLSHPFSWRGSYSEVAFSVNEEKSTKEHQLAMIKEALTGTFIGWKGGEFKYYSDTIIHFEAEEGHYTDGDYAKEVLRSHGIDFSDLETLVIDVAFKP